MDVGATNSIRPSPSTSNVSDDQTGSASALSSDFETFLRMLTVQMENQDPLNPIESSDFAVQLATFSGVEQQVRTNDILSAFTSAMAGTGVGQYAEWIGKEALATAPAYFAGAPISVETQASQGAARADLVVRDQTGRIVDRQPVSVTGGTATWDGMSELGNPFLEGLYSFSVEGTDADGEAMTETPAQIYDRVSEIRVTASGGFELELAGGGTASPDDVVALRLPPE